MTAVALAAPVAAPLSTATARAQALGFPAALFGFTPEQPEYWHEPKLPTLTPAMLNHSEPMPRDYRGQHSILCLCSVGSNDMAPRFPEGCTVHISPVYDKANLVVGRVYVYRYWDEVAQEWGYTMRRLAKIGGNCLEVKADNHPVPSLWLLGEEQGKEVWDVSEVTHYASYPEAAELATTTHLATA